MCFFFFFFFFFWFSVFSPKRLRLITVSFFPCLLFSYRVTAAASFVVPSRRTCAGPLSSCLRRGLSPCRGAKRVTRQENLNQQTHRRDGHEYRRIGNRLALGIRRQPKQVSRLTDRFPSNTLSSRRDLLRRNPRQTSCEESGINVPALCPPLDISYRRTRPSSPADICVPRSLRNCTNRIG